MKGIHRLVAGILGVGLILSGCGCRSHGVKIGGPGGLQEIPVGDFSSLTGDTATFGTSTHNGLALAIEQANAAGGVKDLPIKLYTEDDQSMPDVARTVVTKLITEDHVIAVVGEVASTRSLAAAPICQQYKIPMITPASTNPAVTQKGDYIFRTCFTDDFQAAVMAHFARDQGYKRVAVFKDIRNDYSMGIAKIFEAEFTNLGGTITGEQTYQEGDTDFKAQLNSLKGQNPDAVLIPGYYSEVGTIARQAREIGLNVPLLGCDGWDSPKLIQAAGNALNGCYFSDHYFSKDIKDPAMQKFFADYKAKYGYSPDALAALGFDAGNLLVDALKRAKSLTPADLRDAIATTKDFPGITGKITIDANRNARKAAIIMKIVGEKKVLYKVYTPEEIDQ